MPSPRRLALVGLAVCALVPFITGCSMIKQTVTHSVQDAVEDVTDGDVDLSRGVPDGFPTESVPLIDGNVRGATQESGSTHRWVVAVTGSGVSGTEAKDELTEAGFDVSRSASQEDLGSVTTLVSEDYDVTLLTARQSVVYTVTPND